MKGIIISLLVLLAFVQARSPIGIVENWGENFVSGWTYDPDNSDSSVIVRIYDYTRYLVSSNTSLYHNINSQLSIQGTHGFLLNFSLPLGIYTLRVYAVDLSGEDETKIGEKLVTIRQGDDPSPPDPPPPSGDSFNPIDFMQGDTSFTLRSSNIQNFIWANGRQNTYNDKSAIYTHFDPRVPKCFFYARDLMDSSAYQQFCFYDNQNIALVRDTRVPSTTSPTGNNGFDAIPATSYIWAPLYNWRVNETVTFSSNLYTFLRPDCQYNGAPITITSATHKFKAYYSAFDFGQDLTIREALLIQTVPTEFSETYEVFWYANGLGHVKYQQVCNGSYKYTRNTLACKQAGNSDLVFREITWNKVENIRHPIYLTCPNLAVTL